jgi:hypothetical protein
VLTGKIVQMYTRQPFFVEMSGTVIQGTVLRDCGFLLNVVAITFAPQGKQGPCCPTTRFKPSACLSAHVHQVASTEL